MPLSSPHPNLLACRSDPTLGDPVVQREALKLSRETQKAPRDQLIKRAVTRERIGLVDQRKNKDANAEFGKSVQAQTGTPGRDGRPLCQGQSDRSAYNE
jgi:hypothetical protein